MSKICMILFRNPFNDYFLIEKDIRNIIEIYSMALFDGKKSNEPFMSNYTSYYALSLSDNYKYDNCEMFLLPDGWFYNGKCNDIPFIKRMEIIRDCVKRLDDYKCNIEIFLGESGNAFNDFIHLKCLTNEIPNLIKHNFYDKKGEEYNLHITID